MRFEQVRIPKEDGGFAIASVETENGVFTKIEKWNTGHNIDSVPYLIPGLVDIHFHGCMGADISDGTVEGLETMAAYEASQGITTICPATMSVPAGEIDQAMRAAAEFGELQRKSRRLAVSTDADADMDAKPCAVSSENPSLHSSAYFAGINLEGPFINPAKKGAQAEDAIIPCDIELYRKWQELSGHRIKLVDLAPEMQGSMEFISAVKDEVTVSLAHTCADFHTAQRAFAAGASHVTHLFNAMPTFAHREPGVIGAAFADPKCTVELICDGVHIHPVVIAAVFRLFGRDRVILISDSMRAAGLEDGTYTLGGQNVHVSGRHATLDSGALAGSVTNLMDCMRYAVKEAGIPFADALRAATVNPAKKIGIYDQLGSIEVGKCADCVLMDAELQVMEIYVSGNKLKI